MSLYLCTYIYHWILAQTEAGRFMILSNRADHHHLRAYTRPSANVYVIADTSRLLAPEDLITRRRI
jgi:hypothetical protein